MVIKLPRSRESTPVAFTPPSTTLGLSLPATCDCRTLKMTCYFVLATEGAYQRISGSRGAPAVPHHVERVGSQRTGCSKLSPL